MDINLINKHRSSRNLYHTQNKNDIYFYSHNIISREQI